MLPIHITIVEWKYCLLSLMLVVSTAQPHISFHTKIRYWINFPTWKYGTEAFIVIVAHFMLEWIWYLNLKKKPSNHYPIMFSILMAQENRVLNSLLHTHWPKTVQSRMSTVWDVQLEEKPNKRSIVRLNTLKHYPFTILRLALYSRLLLHHHDIIRL